MLRLECLRAERVAAAGSFKPRNDGPLMEGGVCETVAERRGSCAGAGAASTAAVFDAETDTGCGGTAAWVGGDKSVAPHMPQKRLLSGFSLPQRWQRTESLLVCIAYIF